MERSEPNDAVFKEMNLDLSATITDSPKLQVALKKCSKYQKFQYIDDISTQKHGSSQPLAARGRV